MEVTVKRRYLVIGGITLFLAGVAVAAMAMSRHPASPAGSGAGSPSWGAANPEDLVAKEMAACQANDWGQAALYWWGAPHMNNLQAVKSWCEAATDKWTVAAWEIDKSATTTDGGGMTILTMRAWRDAGKTQPTRVIQWWLKQDAGRWIMMGGR